MSESPRGMPFGSIYGAMFFVLVALCSRELINHQDAASPHAHYALSLLGLALALGLIGRRGWARWSGATFAGLVVALAIRMPDPGVVGLILVFGASIAGLLLLLPATGDARPSSAFSRRETSAGGWLLAGAAGFGALGLLVAFSLPNPGGAADSDAAVPVVRSLGRVSWSDFGSGSQRARAEGRPMMVSFETAWCGFCKKLNRTTWKDGGVISRLSEVVAVRVNAEEATPRSGFKGRDLAARFDVEGYPTLLVLDSEGQLISRTSGYLGPQEFLDWLDRSLGSPAARPRDNMQVSGS